VPEPEHFVTVKVEPLGGNVHRVTEKRTDPGHIGEERVTTPTVLPPPAIVFPLQPMNP
jgi:hypothetical protein